jgi:hypothetical protein
MPLFASPLRVVFEVPGSTYELVKFDDYLEAWPSVAGGQKVDLIDRINASYRKTFPRGNAFHSLTLAWRREYETPALCLEATMKFPTNLSFSRGTLYLYPESPVTLQVYTLLEAAFTNWNSRAEGNIGYFSATIEGGNFF